MLCNFQQMQDAPKFQETKGTKRRPENPTDSDGQLLSNSINLSKGGPKASNRGQDDEAEDLYDLLSDFTNEQLTISQNTNDYTM